MPLPARRALSSVPDVAQQPTPRGRKRASAPSSDAPTDDLHDSKRRLVRKIAEDVVASPDDCQRQQAEAEHDRLRRMEEEARLIREQLRLTLKPWKEEVYSRYHFQHNHGLDDDYPYHSVRVFQRSSMLGDICIEIIESINGHKTNQYPSGWQFNHHKIGQFHHDDLEVVKAMADLMCRLHGYRMTDDPPLSAPEQVQVTRAIPETPPPAMRMIAEAQRSLLEEDGGEWEEMPARTVTQAQADPEPESLVWGSVFGDG